jgi:hypothetical protein
MTGFTTSISQRADISENGIMVPGDMQFGTGLPTGEGVDRNPRKISLFDKLTATWSQPVDGGQVIVRAAGSKGPGAQFTTLEPNEDKLWYEPDESIWCEDENGITYSNNSDFILGPGRIIKWVGNAPLDNVKYTIKYTAFFEWIVFSPPQERNDKNNRDLGQSCSLRKKHIVFMNDNPSANNTAKASLQAQMRC